MYDIACPSGSSHGGEVGYSRWPAMPLPETVWLTDADDRVTCRAFARALGRPRHSATSFLQHVRCERRHWFKYVMGVREPPVDRTGTDFVNAIARGQIVQVWSGKAAFFRRSRL